MGPFALLALCILGYYIYEELENLKKELQDFEDRIEKLEEK